MTEPTADPSAAQVRVAGEWLTGRPAQTVLGLLTAAGHAAHVVGGCVRNALLGLPVGDLDIATDAHPETVIRLAEGAGLRAVPTGIDHGTVTLIVDGSSVEVTTWRRDVATDGRRAVVAFATTMAEDAARRDFTLNALYADRTGAVIDPLGGLPDVLARRVRFIGDPAARIAEDGLRVLRFFRFHALYGDPAQGIDAESLAAIAAAPDALTPVSAERVGHEVLRLLSADDPAPAVAAMAACGVLARVLPGADATALAPLIALEGQAECAPSPLRRLAVLGLEVDTSGLRLSRQDAKRLAALREAVAEDLPPHAIADRWDPDLAADAVLVRAALTQTPPPPGWRQDLELAAAARFPVSAADLMVRYPPGPALGAALARLRKEWVASRFTHDRAALLKIDSDAPI